MQTASPDCFHSRRQQLLEAGAHVFTLSGVTFGPAKAGSTTGITVSTSKDFASSGTANTASGSLVQGDICSLVSLISVQCSIQGAYLMTVLSPLLGPSGSIGFPVSSNGSWIFLHFLSMNARRVRLHRPFVLSGP